MQFVAAPFAVQFGAPRIFSSVLYFHRDLPVEASKAYSSPSLDPTNTLPSNTSGDDSISPAVVKLQPLAPFTRFRQYTLLSPEPMKTCPATTAGEDFTGPAVLKDQSKPGLLGRVPDAIPVSAWLPRNIGQSAALTASAVSATTGRRYFIRPGMNLHSISHEEAWSKRKYVYVLNQ